MRNKITFHTYVGLLHAVLDKGGVTVRSLIPVYEPDLALHSKA